MSLNVITKYLPIFFRKKFLSITVLYITLSSVCYSYQPEQGRVSFSTGPFTYHGDFQRFPDKYYPRAKLGWALIGEAVIAKNAGFEIGLFYFDKPFLRQEGNNYIVQSIKSIYITTGYRYWWSKYFSAAVNIFSSFSMGDVVDIDTSPSVPTDFITIAEKEVTNYGIDFSFRAEIPFSKREEFFIDLRYSSNRTADSRDEANHIGIGLFYSKEIDID